MGGTGSQAICSGVLSSTQRSVLPSFGAVRTVALERSSCRGARYYGQGYIAYYHGFDTGPSGGFHCL